MGRLILSSYNSRGTLLFLSEKYEFWIELITRHSLSVSAKDISKSAQLYCPASSRCPSRSPPGHWIFCPQWLCRQVMYLQKRIKNLFRLLFIQCQYKNTYIYRGERSVSSVLYPDECQQLGLDRLSCLFSTGLQDLLHSHLAFGRGVKNSLIWGICLVIMAFSWNTGTGDLIINMPRWILDELDNY